MKVIAAKAQTMMSREQNKMSGSVFQYLLDLEHLVWLR